MKTYLTYGLAMAVALALLNLAMYFLGFHSDMARMQTGQWIAMPLLLVICIGAIVLGTKARRAEVPAEEGFGYGRALGAGFMIVLFASLFSIVTNALYFGVINPTFCDVLADMQIAKMEAQGLSGQALERAEQGVRFMMKPVMLTIFGFFQSIIGGLIFSLITAAFLKRPASSEPPPVSA